MSLIAFEEKLQHYQQHNFYRHRNVLDDVDDIFVTINEKKYLSFSSNNYLGLAKHPEVVNAVHDGLNKYGAGVTASQLVSGHTRAHYDLEKAMAKFLQCERAVLFSSGYLANLGVISALCSENDVIFADKHNHVSLLDGCRLSGAQLKRYAHNNSQHLATLLEKNSAPKKCIITDSVFSMTGEIAPLNELAELAKKNNCILIVDEAHALGVLGQNGEGAYSAAGLKPTANTLLICPLGKSFGCYGAIVAGNHILIENILQAARTLIYNIALPPMLACGALAALPLARDEHFRRQKLQQLIDYFSSQIKNNKLEFLNSSTPIQILKIGDEKKALQYSEQLLKYGFYITPIRWPSVTKNAAILRISLNFSHEIHHIEQLFAALENIHADLL